LACFEPRAYVLPTVSSDFFKLDNYFDQFDPGFSAGHKEIKFPNNVLLFAVKDIPDTAL
jgi:hypothetical protein